MAGTRSGGIATISEDIDERIISTSLSLSTDPISETVLINSSTFTLMSDGPEWHNTGKWVDEIGNRIVPYTIFLQFRSQLIEIYA